MRKKKFDCVNYEVEVDHGLFFFLASGTRCIKIVNKYKFVIFIEMYSTYCFTLLCVCARSERCLPIKFMILSRCLIRRCSRFLMFVSSFALVVSLLIENHQVYYTLTSLRAHRSCAAHQFIRASRLRILLSHFICLLENPFDGEIEKKATTTTHCCWSERQHTFSTISIWHFFSLRWEIACHLIMQFDGK